MPPGGKLPKQSKGGLPLLLLNTRGGKLVELAQNKGPAGQTQAGEERATQQHAGQDGYGQAQAGQERDEHDQAEQERDGHQEGVEGEEIIPAAIREKVEGWLEKTRRFGVKRALFGSPHQDHHSGLDGPAVQATHPAAVQGEEGLAEPASPHGGSQALATYPAAVKGEQGQQAGERVQTDPMSFTSYKKRKYVQYETSSSSLPAAAGRSSS